MTEQVMLFKNKTNKQKTTNKQTKVSNKHLQKTFHHQFAGSHIIHTVQLVSLVAVPGTVQAIDPSSPQI